MEFEMTVERLLRATDEDDFDPRSLGLEFERTGDIGFDAIARRIDDKSTSDRGRVRALRMLALLSRQFCVRRKPELVEWSIRLMDHPSIVVRTAALNTAVAVISGILRLQIVSPEVGEAMTTRVKEAIKSAIARGVAPEQEDLGLRFLASDGVMLVIASE